ncbi:hypothetical protein LCGC14_1359500 [marine sediment metagenome]|uniref:CSD domain-containing protein n=1 Tax=marine sediment metagenome TaxID=412755 RepID=A0A0F9K8J6_9ZZZZ
MEGRIKLLLTDKNCGFITGGDDTDYFFHISALKNIKYDDLEVGMGVTFVDEEGTRGPRAEDVYA